MTVDGRIQVLLADEHAVLRAGLAAMLIDDPTIDVACDAADGAGALRCAVEKNPDVIVMGIALPDMSGFDTLRAVRERGDDTPVLFLTMYDDPAYVRKAIDLGANGYVLKQAAARELVEAIHTVHDGGLYISPIHAKVVMTDTLDEAARADARERRPSLDVLTEREAEVFRFVAYGHSNQEIAELIHIAPHTVAKYKARVMEKLGLDTRAELVRLALDVGTLH